METRFVKLTDAYKKETIDILNYYIENTTSAYREETVGYDFFDNLVDENTVTAYAVLNEAGTVIGFCALERHKSISTFDSLGDCMYFLAPEATGKGVGKNILEVLENDAVMHGMGKIVVDISDDNGKSVDFHVKNGFREFGRLRACWRKFGKELGIVYMAKDLSPKE